MIKFVLDSASDFSADQLVDIQTPVNIVPLSITFGNDIYIDGVTLSQDEFYEKMEQYSELPKTSQPSPNQFTEVFTELLNEEASVIYFGLASGLSGTFQSATVAKSLLNEAEQNRIHLIETGIASAGIQYLVRYADSLVQKGLSVDEVVYAVNQKKQTLSAFVLLDTLENVRKGGRISGLQGKIGELLNIKPLLKIQHGAVETLDKFRGSKRGTKKLAEIIHQWKEQHESLYIVHSFPTKEEVIQLFSDKFSFDSFNTVYFTRFGSVIGTHAGTKAIGFLAYK